MFTGTSQSLSEREVRKKGGQEFIQLPYPWQQACERNILWQRRCTVNSSLDVRILSLNVRTRDHPISSSLQFLCLSSELMSNENQKTKSKHYNNQPPHRHKTQKSMCAMDLDRTTQAHNMTVMLGHYWTQTCPCLVTTSSANKTLTRVWGQRQQSCHMNSLIE